jgi:hypothetical protein
MIEETKIPEHPAPLSVDGKPMVVNVQLALPPQRRDFLDSASKVMGIMLPLVLGWATLHLTNQQMLTQRQQYRDTVDEQNRGRVMERFIKLGDASVPERLGSAKALHAFADMGRMDASSLPGLLNYLTTECDEGTFSALKATALTVAAHSRSTSVDNANPPENLIKGLDSTTRSSGCPKETSIVVPPASSATTVLSAPPQYFEVGCGEVKKDVLIVPVPIPLQGQQKVQNVSASLVNIDNLKTWSVSVLNYTDEIARVEYRLVGLDRQLFGNCPGGGHGTVVTNFVIGAK